MSRRAIAPVAKIVGGNVTVYDGNSGRVITTFPGPAQAVQVNGNLISVTKTDGRVVVYGAISGRVLRTL